MEKSFGNDMGERHGGFRAQPGLLVGASPFSLLSFSSLPQLLVAGGEWGELIRQLWEDREGAGLLSTVRQALMLILSTLGLGK